MKITSQSEGNTAIGMNYEHKDSLHNSIAELTKSHTEKKYKRLADVPLGGQMTII